MGILAGIIIGFTLIQLTVALVNFLTQPSLPSSNRSLNQQTSILIPARNEEKTLPLLLNDLIHQPFPPQEIIVCDDHSEDHTYIIARQLAATSPLIRIIRGKPLPPGWQGKNYACYQLAQQARGNYLLFLDADVRIGPQGIGPLVVLAQQMNIGLLSVFPRQIMLTKGEKHTVPLMTYILLSLLPLTLVYKINSQSALAAANGQFMLFKAADYHRFQPHCKVRRQVVEDVAISRFYKKAGQRVCCFTGIADISCRMYTSRREAIAGFARNISGFFGGSFLLAFLFWGLTAWGWLPVALSLSWPGIGVYLILRTVLRIIVARTCNQPAGVNLWGSVPQQWNLGIILLRALFYRITGRQEWKGRNILKQK